MLLIALFVPGLGAEAQLNCNVGIDFYANGGIRRCILNGDHRIYTEGGVPISCADGKPLEQHPDGTLARCTLRHPARLDGSDCPARAEVSFDEHGRLKQCRQKSPG